MATFTPRSLKTSVEWSTLPELLHWRAVTQPDQPGYAFLEDGQTQEAWLSYQALDHRARAIGRWLESIGARDQHTVLIYPPGLEFICAFFGCLYAGVVAVPVYPPNAAALGQTVPRLSTIMADAHARVVLTVTPLMFMLKQLLEPGRVRRTLRKTLGRISPRLRPLTQVHQFEPLHWCATDRLPSRFGEDWTPPNLTSDMLALLQYTSGSTAHPKGVMLSHRHLLHNQQMIQQVFHHGEQSVAVGWLPMYHDMGLIGNILHPLYMGFPAILMSPMHFLKRPVRWLQAISHYRACTSGAPNFAYEYCVRKITPQQRIGLDLSSWRVAFNGAEPVRHETLERFAAAFAPHGFRKEAFYPCYGLAESTLIVSGRDRTEPPVSLTVQKAALEEGRVVLGSMDSKDSRSLVGCGRPVSDARVVIVDPTTLLRCPDDQVGEVWVSGMSVAHGYWNRPQETQETFHAYLGDTREGPFLRTGDLGFLHRGELFITGRIKDLIIIRGRNHYPQDLELTVEQSHPVCRPGCGAVFPIDTGTEEEVVVVQELRGERPRDLNDVIRAIRQRIAEEHQIHVDSIVLIQARTIPKTSSGKIQRRACKAAFLAADLEVIKEWHAR